MRSSLCAAAPLWNHPVSASLPKVLPPVAASSNGWHQTSPGCLAWGDSCSELVRCRLEALFRWSLQRRAEDSATCFPLHHQLLLRRRTDLCWDGHRYCTWTNGRRSAAIPQLARENWEAFSNAKTFDGKPCAPSPSLAPESRKHARPGAGRAHTWISGRWLGWPLFVLSPSQGAGNISRCTLDASHVHSVRLPGIIPFRHWLLLSPVLRRCGTP